jgi:peptidoglycan/LPS O-acetylase OafA/YrhL
MRNKNYRMIHHTPGRFLELDALRGLAAILVVFFHCILSAELWSSVFLFGTTGVDLFFIISGFVILLSIEKASSARQFIINRFIRLYPTYWTVVSITFLLIVIEYLFNYTNVHIDIMQYLTNLTMFQYYFHVNDLDGPYWTMIIEMLFYIYILLLYKLKCLQYQMIIGLALSITTAVFCTFFYEATSMAAVIEIFPLLPFIPLFTVGSLFYKIYTERNQLIYRYCMIILSLVSQVILFPYAGRSHYYISTQQYTLVIIGFFFLFVLFVHGKLRWIVNPVSLFLGKISFALYLIHQHISIMLILPYFVGSLGIPFWITVLCIDLPIVIALATFVTNKVEVPVSKKLKRFFSKKQNLN